MDEVFILEAKLNGIAVAGNIKGEWSAEAEEYKKEVIDYVDKLQARIAELEAQVERQKPKKGSNSQWFYPH